MSIEIQGLDELIKRLEKIANNEGIKNGIEKATLEVERVAKQKAPKDTGALKASIESKVESDSDGVQGVVFTPLEYAPYQEYGTGLFAENGGRTDVPWFYEDDKGEGHRTSGNKPHPFMRPALAESKEKIKEYLKEELLKND